MKILKGVIRPYAWGSRTVIAEMQGRPSPSAHPEAELWFGSHPVSPAICTDCTGDLLTLIDDDPIAALGEATVQTFEGRLPFLIKILAADEPLSLQAHPSKEQARAGFAAENEAGLAADDPRRNYKDRWHKPEIVVALTDFEALAGFRDPAQTVELLRSLQVPGLDSALGLLAGSPDEAGLRAVFTTWLTLPERVIAELVPDVLAGAVRLLEGGQTPFADELRAVLELGEVYPNDPGVLAALLLNFVRLQAGEAIFLDAGNLHAYLRGSAVEAMANSDNVLRGGLTPKHIDVPELLRVLDFRPVSREQMVPAVEPLGAELIYLTPAPEFRLSRVELDGTGLRLASSISFDMPGPQILAVTAGRIEVAGPDGTRTTVECGEALWLADDDPDVTVYAASSQATFFRTRVPLESPAP
ncbi:mannose-6-phosphate isomerase [Gordonia hirsuta DSM 44140 = NBRC 16056]|uniref:mannose-6-phosphate isomerase n=1 Tax=Gordonia hirsuta DSM 44140 = NBRC 16056 TaxID=1121927 RepID=L7L829_9ACTN|nr:mannose-6-phosphate isomerase, class I [Gordonia hirsuta]GAC56207.1 mannose-6-phosphate isomerase [Gordonia hirsuta DSM 44140 = NBRC 16056]